MVFVRYIQKLPFDKKKALIVKSIVILLVFLLAIDCTRDRIAGYVNVVLVR
jgi:hypothetical protein